MTAKRTPFVTTLACAFVVAAAVTASRASAADSSAQTPAAVPVNFDMDQGSVRIVGEGVDTSCLTPCIMHLSAGWYEVKTKLASDRLFFDRASRVSFSRGSPGLATASTVMLVAGAAIALAAVLIPAFACHTNDSTVDQFGRVHEGGNLCRNISDGVKVAWIAGGGVGLTLALVGGFSLALSGPSLGTRAWREGSASLRLRF